MKIWLSAFRLRTLPLAFSCIIMGSGLAMADGKFNLIVFGLALITTLFLQILSNLANDYGDFVKGTDNEERVGPKRTMQSGFINVGQMKKAMWVIALLCSIFGVWLIYEGTLGLDLKKAGLFAILGLTAMGAAVKYTMGKN
ncbi:MAG: 1,4-dihydroxy-2-naphthoate octaprenyltransferase, partial [Candidatus Marinimicrobia bacterium]|nr:1,4-dihydroxy-2-naphthoate octaprenyltransferase [Candidatus Neomarinimicrobiota bacterium]